MSKSIVSQIYEVLSKEIEIEDELGYCRQCEEELDVVITGVRMRRQELEKELEDEDE